MNAWKWKRDWPLLVLMILFAALIMIFGGGQ